MHTYSKYIILYKNTAARSIIVSRKYETIFHRNRSGQLNMPGLVPNQCLPLPPHIATAIIFHTLTWSNQLSKAFNYCQYHTTTNHTGCLHLWCVQTIHERSVSLNYPTVLLYDVECYESTIPIFRKCSRCLKVVTCIKYLHSST